jgi:hypothetical protein
MNIPVDAQHKVRNLSACVPIFSVRVRTNQGTYLWKLKAFLKLWSIELGAWRLPRVLGVKDNGRDVSGGR